MNSGKTIEFLQVFHFDTYAEVPLCPIEADWRSLLVMKRQSYRLSNLAYLTRAFSYRYAPHLKRPQFNDLIVECNKILTDMVKMLERKVVEIVENLEPEPELDNKPGPEVVAELMSLQEEIFSQPMEVVELSIETIVDLPAEFTIKLVPPLAVMRASIS